MLEACARSGCGRLPWCSRDARRHEYVTDVIAGPEADTNDVSSSEGTESGAIDAAWESAVDATDAAVADANAPHDVAVDARIQDAATGDVSPTVVDASGRSQDSGQDGNMGVDVASAVDAAIDSSSDAEATPTCPPPGPGCENETVSEAVAQCDGTWTQKFENQGAFPGIVLFCATDAYAYPDGGDAEGQWANQDGIGPFAFPCTNGSDAWAICLTKVVQ